MIMIQIKISSFEPCKVGLLQEKMIMLMYSAIGIAIISAIVTPQDSVEILLHIVQE